MSKFTVNATGCWEWTATRASNGYGMLRVMVDGNWRKGLAHRVAYAVFFGITPSDEHVVMHICDNRGCVRADHLRLATQSANIIDMDQKGRRNPDAIMRGERHGNAKLTEAAVREIRARYTGKYGNLTALAAEFGVTPQAVRSVALHKGWNHVN